MKHQCDFSIGFDREIEDISMYPDNHLSKKMCENMLNDSVSDNSLFVGERCEGTISYDVRNNRVVISSKSCTEVGEDWDSDNWNENNDIIFPNDRIRIR